MIGARQAAQIRKCVDQEPFRVNVVLCNLLRVIDLLALFVLETSKEHKSNIYDKHTVNEYIEFIECLYGLFT